MKKLKNKKLFRETVYSAGFNKIAVLGNENWYRVGSCYTGEQGEEQPVVIIRYSGYMTQKQITDLIDYIEERLNIYIYTNVKM